MACDDVVGVVGIFDGEVGYTGRFNFSNDGFVETA